MDLRELSILGYVVVSAVMLNVNKLALQNFDAPYFLTLVQTVVTCVVLLVLGCFGFASLSWRHAKRFVFPGAVWALPLAFNMQALKHLNPETVVVFRAATVFGVASGDLVWFKKNFLGHQLLSLFFITLGASLYVSGDLNYNQAGYLWGLAYWTSMVASVLLLKAVFNANKDIGPLEKTFYLNLNGSVVFFCLAFTTESGKVLPSVQSLTRFGFMVISVSCVLAVAIGFLSNITRDALSATAFDVLGNVAKFATIAISHFLFRTEYTVFSASGLCFALLGGALYSPDIYRSIEAELKVLSVKVKAPRRLLFFIVLVCSLVSLSATRYFPPGAFGPPEARFIFDTSTHSANHGLSIPKDQSHPFHALKYAFSTKLALRKVAEVNLTGETDPFFVAIVPHEDGLLASYRTRWRHRTRVGYLDRNFELNKTKVIHEIPQVEDGRVVWWNNTNWLVDNHFDFPRVMVSFDGQTRIALDESGLGADFYRGKNWSPFVYLDELYFVYSLEPVRILRCVWPDAKLVWVYFDGGAAISGNRKDTRSGVTASHLEIDGGNEPYLRGGTNALVFGGNVYGVARYSYQALKKTCKGREVSGFKEHFPVLWSLPVDGMFASDNLETRKLRRLRVREIEHPFTRGVNDPASLFVWNDEPHVSITSCSCDCDPSATDLNEYVRNEIYKITMVEN
jgi:hypothetical protein